MIGSRVRGEQRGGGIRMLKQRETHTGWLRRVVILTVFLFSFTLALFWDYVVFKDQADANLVDDVATMRDEHRVPDHFWSLILSTLILNFFDFCMSFYYGLPSRAICSAPCCFYFRLSVYLSALWLFIFNIIVYFVLIKETTIFASKHDLLPTVSAPLTLSSTGWIFAYGFYLVVLQPPLILQGDRARLHQRGRGSPQTPRTRPLRWQQCRPAGLTQKYSAMSFSSRKSFVSTG